MTSSPAKFFRDCLAKMLEPLIAFCLKRGIHFQDFSEIAKRVFVESARKQLSDESAVVSASKLGVMTGLQRKDVSRLMGGEAPTNDKDFVARVLGQWCGDRRFSDRSGNPKPLSIIGLKSDFSRLVRAVSTDLNPHTVRFELERLGHVELKDGKACLRSQAHVVTGDPLTVLRMGSDDTRDLLHAIQENAFLQNSTPHLHAKTEYDNVPEEALPEIREWFLDRGTEFHQDARKYLAKFDCDINPEAKRGEARYRVAVGTFSFIGEVSSTQKKDKGGKS